MPLTRTAVEAGLKTFFFPFQPGLTSIPSTVTLYISFWNSLTIESNNDIKLSSRSDVNISNELLTFDIVHNTNQKNYTISNRSYLFDGTSTRKGTFRYITFYWTPTNEKDLKNPLSTVVLPNSITINPPGGGIFPTLNRFRIQANEVRFKFEYI